MNKHDFCRASSLPDFECNNCGEAPEHPIHNVRHCTHCTFVIDCNHEHEHINLCCDCFDLSWGAPLDYINKERTAKGLPLLVKPWP